MRTLLLAVFFLTALIGQAAAQGTPVTPVPGQPIANSFQQITPSTATALTVPSGATWAYITVEGQSVRWRDDGTAPTSSVGWLLPVGAAMYYKVSGSSGPLSALQFIQTIATATIDVSYYK